AVGSRFQREEDDKRANRVQTVTIEADARTAEAVSVASEIGSLSLALRSFALVDREGDGAQQEALGARVVAWAHAVGINQNGPVWRQDISRVYQSITKPSVSKTVQPKVADTSASARLSQSRTITVIRGENSEQLQFQISTP